MVKEPFNLIITHYPGYDNFVVVREQLRSLLDDIRIIDTSQSIILALVKDSYASVDLIKESGLSETPILRVIPVDKIVDVYVDRVAESVKSLVNEKIGEKESFMIKIDGRLYERIEDAVKRLHKSEAISIIADGINRPVNLNAPDWLIYIKTVRLYRVTELATVTVCKPNYILSFAPKET